MKQCTADRIQSPVGELWAVVDEEGVLLMLEFEGGRNAPRSPDELVQRYGARGYELRWSQSRLRPVARALREYFEGERTRFDLPVAPEGTAFQRSVWEQLRTIPFGATWTYGQLAQRLGRPGAARAVGAANGANPISIVIPCHRVIGSDGSLTGYGGGMRRKQALLELEGAR